MNASPSSLQIGDMILRFSHDPKSGRVGLQILPGALDSQTVSCRKSLRGLPFIDAIPDSGEAPARVLDSLIQIKLVGDSYPGAFAQGHTLRGSPSIDRFRFDSQTVSQEGASHVCRTHLSDSEGIELEHCIRWQTDASYFTVSTVLRNNSSRAIGVEMLSSFSLGGISPFDSADAPGRLRVHRFRSNWSAEGRLDSQSIERLHLERSWSGAGAFSERFGQVGSMPVRRWFPFVAVEDTEANVLWGAQLAWAGSWQMEIFRQHDDVCLSGGLADREFGHWLRQLPPGETLESPEAIVSCVHGDLDELCDRLTSAQIAAVETQPEVEHDLPIVFNEWCTTWGDPSEDKLLAIARRLKGTPVRYLVIDAGWYKTETSDWSSGHGDWLPSSRLFPQGLEHTAELIREEGLIPGLWFEMETVGSSSMAFHGVQHLLRRDGLPITVRERRFWDLQDPAAIENLSSKVIDLLERCGFGYLKVDYNETVGLGCDNHEAESLGEGLRRQTLASYRFFEKIRQRLPQLVIENCASGGHRLEPSMLARSAMSSFSDAHELPEIPIIAANLHRLLLPRQSQIWAVLHADDSERRLIYSLAATFLGRMCLSGEIDRLSPEQWNLVQRSMEIYRRSAPVIKEGKSRLFRETGESWRHPTGWQAVRRINSDQALVVWHAFADAPRAIFVPLPADRWTVTETFSSPRINTQIVSQGLMISAVEDFSGGIVLLRKSSDP